MRIVNSAISIWTNAKLESVRAFRVPVNPKDVPFLDRIHEYDGPPKRIAVAQESRSIAGVRECARRAREIVEVAHAIVPKRGPGRCEREGLKRGVPV
jgi:hypothetical protein